MPRHRAARTYALRRAQVLGLGGTVELADAVLATPRSHDFSDPQRWRDALAWLVARDARLEQVEWTIVELATSYQLAHEGRAMHHCVASYARACLAGQSSIWSLRHRWYDEETPRPFLTIEVRLATSRIVQVRGVANSKARGRPLELVPRWAARESLRFAAAGDVQPGGCSGTVMHAASAPISKHTRVASVGANGDQWRRLIGRPARYTVAMHDDLDSRATSPRYGVAVHWMPWSSRPRTSNACSVAIAVCVA